MYISLHSFGQMILYPWSYTKVPIDDWLELDLMARKWSNAIYESSNGRYKYKASTKKSDDKILYNYLICFILKSIFPF